MSEKIMMSEESIKIITSTLGVKKLEEVLERKFPDDAEDSDVEREDVDLYQKRIRGSVRLRTGRFYTRAEFQERKRRVLALQLP